MFLHDIGFDKFDIACEDTLTAPQHWDDEPFELIVSINWSKKVIKFKSTLNKITFSKIIFFCLIPWLPIILALLWQQGRSTI